jgi:methylmalonyl-CoA mutase
MVAAQEFEKSSGDKWISKILSDLKGKPLTALQWESEIGLIDPVLFDYHLPEEYPASFPFKRGYQSKSNQWLIAQSFEVTDAKASNNKILKSLGYGVNHLRIFISSPLDFNVLFNEVMLDIISTEIICSSSIYNYALTAIQNLINERNYNPSLISCVVSQDPLSGYFQLKSNPFPIPKSTFTISAALYADAGASIDKQIAFALAHGHEYLVKLVELGTKPSELPSLLRFELAVGTSYFLEIAKIRAFRTLWATILSEYGVESEFAITNIHIKTSGFYYSNLDIHNNLLRSTTAAMSAIIAGCNSLEILPYDHYLAEEKRVGDGMRLATNIQLILQEEAYLGQVVDAAGGSYYIESITDKLITQSWHLFKEIEQSGGLVAAFQSGELINLLNADLSKRIQQYRSGDLLLIGVNKYPNPSEKNNELKYENLQHTDTISSFRLAQMH